MIHVCCKKDEKQMVEEKIKKIFSKEGGSTEDLDIEVLEIPEEMMNDIQQYAKNKKNIEKELEEETTEEMKRRIVTALLSSKEELEKDSKRKLEKEEKKIKDREYFYEIDLG